MPARKEKELLILVDGSNYVFRAFYAIHDLSNSKGFPTNAIYGFTTMLMKLMRDFQPMFMAVVFDMKGPTFRHDAYAEYKATRKPIPEALVPQIPVIKEIVGGFSIPILEKEGIEADDIIGTLARRYGGEEMQVVIVSGDKDMMQLISQDITMVDTMKDVTYDKAAVVKRFGVGPDKVVEILGLTGDATDNIPGVPGIGPKGARSLITEFGTVEGVIANVDRIKNAGMKKAISTYAEQARLSRELAEIKTDLDIDFDLEEAHCVKPDHAALMRLFREYEFSSLLQGLKLEEERLAGRYRLVFDLPAFEVLLQDLRGVRAFSLDLLAGENDPMQGAVAGIAVSWEEGSASYIPLNHDYEGAPRQLPEKIVFEKLGLFLADAKIEKHGHDWKNLLLVLVGKELQVAGMGMDTMVAAYVLNPSQRSFDMDEILPGYLNRMILRRKDMVGSGSKALSFTRIPCEHAMEYACQRVDGILRLAGVLAGRIEQDGLTSLFKDLEMPLVPVLAAMERKGVLLDLPLFNQLSEETAQLMSLSEEKIYSLAGERFNINSPKQLQVVLYDKLGLPRGRRIKEGYSTDVEILAKLAKSHALPAEILAYRSLAKLKSTYIDALPQLVNPETGRVHTTYNQTVTATGRLSSSNPNLQNIPIRTLEGKRIRQAFIAPKGWAILAADYSQIELRVLAHLSGDESLLHAFSCGEDIHSKTASEVFGVFPEMVNSEMRRQAKVINFGIIYGMSAFGLAKELDVPQKQAQAYIDGYFQQYKGVRDYLDKTLDQAHRDGFVTTLLLRRRYLPEIASSVSSQRQFAERMAINTPIQGTAAELIKMAMISISARLSERKLRAAMIMQVHDELVFEVPEEEKEEVRILVKKEMEGVAPLRVPLNIDIREGNNWDEAHG